MALSSCAYLHNYFAEPDDTLFLPQFAELTSTYPVFAGDDVEDLSAPQRPPGTMRNAYAPLSSAGGAAIHPVASEIR